MNENFILQPYVAGALRRGVLHTAWPRFSFEVSKAGYWDHFKTVGLAAVVVHGDPNRAMPLEIKPGDCDLLPPLYFGGLVFYDAVTAADILEATRIAIVDVPEILFEDKRNRAK